MKNRIVLLLGIVVFMTSLQTANAQKLVWRSDIRQAAAEASKTQKPMLVDVTATWCFYCKKMKKTYAHQQISKQVQDCFIPVRLDADQNQKFVNAIGVEALPATVILSPDFKVIKKIEGYQTPAELSRQLARFCKAKSQQLQIAKRSTQTSFSKHQAKPAPFAFKKLCLVTLLEKREMKYGDARFSSKYKGQKICFVSAKMKQKFDTNPEKYWPVLDGNCVVNYADKRTKKAGNPGWVAVYRNRTWFFATDAERQLFAKTPNRYLPYGTRNIARAKTENTIRN